MKWMEQLLMSYPGATDIHLTWGRPLSVRHEGRIVRSRALSDPFLKELLSGLSDRQKETLRESGACDSSFSAGSIRCRLHCYQSEGRVSAAVRLLPALSSLPEDADQAWLAAVACMPAGLVLITGATGSGKSTIMARLIQTMSRRPCHIVTIEDPVEYIFPQEEALIHQREVGRDTASFGSGVIEALREDPDVIAIGEMRDPETISAALAAAETGHLVAGTLHNDRAADAIGRIAHSFPAEKERDIRRRLASVLRAVSAQTLCRLGKRVFLIREILVNTQAVSHLIEEGKDKEILSYMEMGTEGMRSYRQALTQIQQRERLTGEEAETLRETVCGGRHW